MKFHLYKLNQICILSLRNSTIFKLIKTPLCLITINEGSHTRLIHYLNNNRINTKVLQQKEEKIEHINRRIRYVWLETSIYTKMTFARSLWQIKQKELNIKKLKRQSPIGQSFINQQIDTKKYIHELYYCHCQDFEKKLRSKKPIWGRKYKLNYENKSYILIQEFFTPEIMFFFNEKLNK
uniref:Chorismate lyase n=1 Tax=Polysiphonia sp. TaxID=1967842 RepID=A0A1Z1M407_9FLOR|nr:hypothetical protein [Polysiphonia sp.]